MFLLISKTLLEKFADFHWGLGVMLQNIKVIHTTLFGWFMENPPHIVWFLGFGVFHKNQVLREISDNLPWQTIWHLSNYSSEEFPKNLKIIKIQKPHIYVKNQVYYLRFHAISCHSRLFVIFTWAGGFFEISQKFSEQSIRDL